MNVNKNYFKVIKLLGKGKGGYSYLVTDGEKKYVLSDEDFDKLICLKCLI